MSVNDNLSRFLFGVCSGIFIFHFILTPPFNTNKLSPRKESQKIERHELVYKQSDDHAHSHKGLDLGIDEHHHNDNTTIADSLKEKIKVFCIISAKTVDLPDKSFAISQTWAKRCTKTVFFANNANVSEFDFTILQSSWPIKVVTYKDRMKEIIQTTFQKYYDEADWFYFATDENYVIMENLRHFLSDKHPQEPWIFGEENSFSRFDFDKPGLPWQYITHHTGFLLSKNGLKVVSTGLEASAECKDPVVGNLYKDYCLHKTPLRRGNTKDAEGREMFNCIPPEHLDILTFQHGGDVKSNKPVTISEYAISFCMIKAPKQYGLEFESYHLSAYGIIKSHVYT